MTTEFKKLLLESIPYLERLALKLVKCPNEAEDLLQSTLENLIKNADYFREGSNFSAWITIVMRNNFINGYRKKKRRKEWLFKTERKVLSTAKPHIANDGLQNLNLALIHRKIECLNEKYRVPFVMMIEGYQYEEIAEKMKVPLGTIKSRIYVARQKLQFQLKELRA